MEQISYTPAGPVVEAFHQSNAFVRGLLGPVGSSKSSASCIELFDRACNQAPDQKIRRSRWAVLRNTYPELKSTTIKTWLEWFPHTVMKWDAPISGRVTGKLPDGTSLEMEVYFLALERPEDVGKLKSLELTGAWMNEAGEMAKGVFDMLTQRVGRYPSKKRGGPTWSGVIMDTNPPDDDHWYYKLAEEQKYEGFEFFKQPGGLHKVLDKWVPNPAAENIENLPNGHNYYLRQVAGKTEEWIKVFLGGGYGAVFDGKRVFPEYNDDIHCREIEVMQGLPLLIGLDYGLTPAAAICQITPRGQFRILDECVAEDMGIYQFARDILKPHLAMHYPKFQIIAIGDPAGNRRSDSDEKTCFQILAEEMIPAVPAITNEPVARREALAKPMLRMIDGNPGFLVSPKAKTIRKGLNGGYHYKRVQVGGERYRDVPEKNKYSHPVEAGEYAALHANFMDVNNTFGSKIVYPKNTAYA